MSLRVGSKFLGSTDLQTSSANQEIIPQEVPEGWTIKYKLKAFSFHNVQAAKVKINGSDPIYLGAGKGFNSNINSPEIYSFVIITEGIDFHWVGLI